MKEAMKIKITFKSGVRTVATVVGRDMEMFEYTSADMEKIIATEQYLERLTGLRVHIDEAHGGK